MYFATNIKKLLSLDGVTSLKLFFRIKYSENSIRLDKPSFIFFVISQLIA